MKKYLIPILLTISQLSYSQQECRCATNFELIFQKVRDNYAGWGDKVTTKTQASFDKITADTRDKVVDIKNEKECYKAINDWISFFKDGHVFIGTVAPYSEDVSAAEIEKRAAKLQQLPYSNEAAFMQYLNTNPTKLKSVEGIWESDDKGYRLGIVRDKNNENKFSAFLLSDRDSRWKAGKTKFEMTQVAPNRYTTTYYYADFSGEKCLTREVKDFLVLENIYKFQKVYPKPAETASTVEIQQKIADYRVEKLDDETALIVLPPFTMSNAYELVADLVSKNLEILGTTPNLIIDIRNNPGGDDFSYVPLFPFIYTNPIVRQSGFFRASEENIISIAHELEVIQSIPIYQERLVPKLQPVLRDMQSNIGRFIKGPDKEFTYGVVMNTPKKVAILANRNTASTAENMIFEAKQSKKVTFFGENTKGLADYTDVRDWALPCYGWRIAFALAKSPRLPNNPIDNVGIKPDVKIPDETADWVEFTRQYLKKSN